MKLKTGIKILTLVFFNYNCTEDLPIPSNEIERELSTIPKNISANELKYHTFKTCKIEFRSYLESSDGELRYYPISPFFDTSKYIYSLTFDDGEYSKWKKINKEEYGIINYDKEKCIKNTLSLSDENDELIKIVDCLYYNQTDSNYYFASCNSDDKLLINKFDLQIDHETFEYLGDFALDKNSVFGIYETSDGKYIYKITEADRNTFKILGNSIYGKDDYNVFNSIKGIMPVENIDSFRIINEVISHDNKNYYFLGNKVTDSSEIYTIRGIVKDFE